MPDIRKYLQDILAKTPF